MAWELIAYAYGGTGDARSEGLTIFGAHTSDLVSAADRTSVTFPFATAGTYGTVRTGWLPTAKFIALSGALKASATPSSPLPLASRDDVPSHVYAAVGTDLKIHIYDNAGNQLGTSVGAISTSSATEFAVFWMQAGVATISVVIFLGGAFDVRIDAPSTTLLDAFNYFAIGGHSGASGLGADLSGYVFLRATNDEADAPYNVPYPRLHAAGSLLSPASSVGDEDAWSLTGAATKYAAITDSSDSSYIESQTLLAAQLFQHSTDLIGGGTPVIPSDATIDHLAYKYVFKTINASKLGSDMLMKLGGTELVTPAWSAGSSYVGAFIEPDRPGGGAWTRADAGLDGGGKSLVQFGFSLPDSTSPAPSSRTVLAPAPDWIWHNGVLSVDDVARAPVLTNSARAGGYTGASISTTLAADAGPNRLFVVFTGAHFNQAVVANGVTYGGTPLTKLYAATPAVAGEVCYLIDVGIGAGAQSKTLQVTWDQSPPFPGLTDKCFTAEVWGGVHQSSPFGTVFEAHNTGASVYSTITDAIPSMTIADCLVVDSSLPDGDPVSGQTTVFAMQQFNGIASGAAYISGESAGYVDTWDNAVIGSAKTLLTLGLRTAG